MIWRLLENELGNSLLVQRHQSGLKLEEWWTKPKQMLITTTPQLLFSQSKGILEIMNLKKNNAGRWKKKKTEIITGERVTVFPLEKPLIPPGLGLVLLLFTTEYTLQKSLPCSGKSRVAIFAMCLHKRTKLSYMISEILLNRTKSLGRWC